MFKFGFGFKSSFNVYKGKKNKGIGDDVYTNTESIIGAYRTKRDEFYVYNNNNSENQRKSAPAAPTIPAPPIPPPIPSELAPLRQIKSTSDLIRDKNLSPNLRPAQSGVSLDPRGAQTENTNKQPDTNKTPKLDAQKRVDKQRLAEEKKIEKQRLIEEKKFEKRRLEEKKKREKEALQAQAREEKMRKEAAKLEEKQAKKSKNKKAQAPAMPLANPLAQNQTSNPLAQPSGTQYSTNTLDSSISKTSGPPPYEDAKEERIENGNKSNVSFSKPVDTGSWDMISQHRQQILNNRPAVVSSHPKVKQTTIDLHYTMGEESNKVNSDA